MEVVIPAYTEDSGLGEFEIDTEKNSGHHGRIKTAKL